MRTLELVAACALVAGLATGCAGTYGVTVADDGYGPDLVYAAPGVQVIADYDEPIFYSDGLYWRLYGGTWYRSSYYNGGWIVGAPPLAVRRIDHPRAFVHYRPHGWVARRRYGPGPPHEHRGHAEPRRFEPRPAAGPTMRGGPRPPMNRGAPPSFRHGGGDRGHHGGHRR